MAASKVAVQAQPCFGERTTELLKVTVRKMQQAGKVPSFQRENNESLPALSHMTKLARFVSMRPKFHADGTSSTKGMCATVENCSPKPECC